MGPLPVVFLFLMGGTDPPAAPPVIQDPLPLAPLTGISRLDWAVQSTIGPASLWTGLLSAGWGTAFDHPTEYGRSVDGFAKRYGLRLSGVATSNVMEAGLGAIWGEDPRYSRSRSQLAGGRFSRAVKMTFMSERDGRLTPAYGRYIAIAGSNVISDAWRPDSDRGPGKTMSRIGMGFGGRLLGNLWEEFWPDFKHHLFFVKH